MAPGTTNLESSAVERAPFNRDFQAAVMAELDSMLKASIFAQSGRCKRFLNHVVVQTLAGNAAELKERTIGIAVFERTNNYDTGDDSIVRVTANEVRKRLAQYYGESPGTHPIQIELPRGSYVPEFRVQAPRKPKKLEGQALPEPVSQRPHALETTHETPPELPFTPLQPGPPRKSSRNPLALFITILLVVLAGVVVLGLVRNRSVNRIPDLWSSFLHPTTPVLVCIDTHQLPIPGPASTQGQTFVDLVLRKQIISLDDAAVLSAMGAMLGKKDIPFRVVGADQTSLADLRRQPVILIGAIDNQWTTRLTAGLPYRIEVANPPGSGAAKEPVASIVDSKHAGTRWTTDLSVPFGAWKSDYAIVARMDDVTTGVPVLMEAGLGNDGTLAASEWIISDGSSTALSREPSCRDKTNFEAVIETQIIDTKSGPPHVLRLACW